MKTFHFSNIQHYMEYGGYRNIHKKGVEQAYLN